MRPFAFLGYADNLRIEMPVHRRGAEGAEEAQRKTPRCLSVLGSSAVNGHPLTRPQAETGGVSVAWPQAINEVPVFHPVVADEARLLAALAESILEKFFKPRSEA